MPEEVIEIHDLNPPARPYEAGPWPAMAKRGDEPRALPWAGMKQAVGLKAKPLGVVVPVVDYQDANGDEDDLVCGSAGA
jgi:hypothetical protein